MVKRRFIENVKEGDKIEDAYLVKSVKTGETRAGKPYLVVTVSDRSGEISGPIWNKVERLKQICRVGQIVEVTGSVQSYRDQLQLKIDLVKPVDRSTVNEADFVPAAPGDHEGRKSRLQKLVSSVSNQFLRKLLHRFFIDGGWWHQFQQASAAKGIHHSYAGGLLEHSLSVAAIADFLASHYPGINRSLLLAGALLHDIGKLQELQTTAGVTDYTSAGRLVGHIVMGSQIVRDEAREIENFPPELLDQLVHIIISHHGRREFGSPTLPMTVEALILSFIDDLDSKVNVTEQLRRKMTSSEMSWSEYQYSLERFLYLGGFEESVKNSREERPDSGKHQPKLF